jgi:hypothetical protein
MKSQSWSASIEVCKIFSICRFMASSNRGKRLYNIGFTVFPVLEHLYLSVLNCTDMYFWGILWVSWASHVLQEIINHVSFILMPLLEGPLDPGPDP